MSLIQSILSSHWTLVIYGVASAAMAGAALMWSKYPVRWLLGIATVGIIYFVVALTLGEIDDQLPEIFHAQLGPVSLFKVWVLVLGLVFLYLLTHFVATLIRHFRRPSDRDSEVTGTYPDLDAAWQEILIQLSQARIDPTSQSLYVLLTPEEPLAEAVIDAGGLQLFVKAPSSPEAPIHAYAIAEGLFLSVAGASALGRQDQEGSARLRHLCQLIGAQSPELPTLRGVAVLLPFEWANAPDSLRHVSAVRDDLQTIRRTFKVRCPTLTIFCLRESVPGFNEFASRLPGKLRHNRCGFSVPMSLPPGVEVFRQGMLWMTQWFQSWSLNLMVQDIRNKGGNERLLNMIAAFRSGKSPLAKLLESALTVHQQTEPVLYRGCYFVACGPTPDKQAFSAGLINGGRGRLLADQALTSWSSEADRLDRRYRKAAWLLALGTGALAVPIWYFGIISRLAQSQQASSWTLVAWSLLLILLVVWAAVLVGPSLRRSPKVRS